MRLPSKGMSAVPGLGMRGSAMIAFHPASRASLEGQVIQEKTTVSPSSRFTAMGKEVSVPSGTSSPQHSTTESTPCSLNTPANCAAWARYSSRRAVGTASTKPST